jgi:hypothetical protein
VDESRARSTLLRLTTLGGLPELHYVMLPAQVPNGSQDARVAFADRVGSGEGPAHPV